MKNSIFFITIVSFFIVLACSPKVDDTLKQAEKLMKNMPDSSFHILQNLEEGYPKMTEEEKALYAILYIESAEKSKQKLAIHEQYINFSINYYNRKNKNRELAEAYFYKAHTFKMKRDYANAVNYLLKSKEVLGSYKDYSLLGKIYLDLGQISGYQDEFEKGLNYFQISIDNFEKVGENNNMAKALTIKGWTYMAMNNFDSAICSAQKVLQVASDSAILGDAFNDIGNSYYFKDEFDSALYYMRKSMHYPALGSNKSLRYYNLGNVYAYTKQYDSALVYVHQALQNPIDIFIEEECYRVLINIALARDDKENLPRYLSRRQACQDSINSLAKQPNITLLEKVHKSDIETVEIKNQRKLLAIGLIFLVLAGNITFFIFHKRSKQKQIKADEYKQEHEKVQQIYNVTKLEADSYKLELKKKQQQQLLEFTNEFEQVKEKYAAVRKKASFEEREQIDKTVYNEVLHMDNEAVFVIKMNKILNNLPEKLKTDYPDIAYKEIVWCCLFMLQLPTNEIALLLDFKQSTQYKFKQRLSKKLHFNTSKELEQMLYSKNEV